MVGTGVVLHFRAPDDAEISGFAVIPITVSL
jgi:hypothetical protein